MASQEDLTRDERSVIWLVVVFTCLLETMHSLPSQAIVWLLHFLGSLFTFLSQYSNNIANIAHAFPSTLHRRTSYISKNLSLPSVRRYVVCQACLSLHSYSACLERRGSLTQVKDCPECEKKKKTVPLLREVMTRTGNKNYLMYPYVSLVSSLQSLLLSRVINESVVAPGYALFLEARIRVHARSVEIFLRIPILRILNYYTCVHVVVFWRAYRGSEELMDEELSCPDEVEVRCNCNIETPDTRADCASLKSVYM